MLRRDNESLSRRIGFLLLSSLALGGLAAACQRVDPQTDIRLRAELRRLEGVVRKLEAGMPKKKADFAYLHGQLAAAGKSTSPSLRLYRLRDPFTDAESYAFVLDHPAAQADLAAFEKLWAEHKGAMSAPAPAAPAAPLLQALAQAEQNRAEKVYQASLLYGRAASPWAGLYYLGEAEAHRKLRDFVSSLSLPEGDGAKPDRVAIQAALESLEAESLKGFSASPGTDTMIPTSALLKEARELFERGSLEAAGLTLLGCRVSLSLLPGRDHPAPAASKTTASSSSSEMPPEGSLAAPFVASAAEEKPKGRITAMVRDEVLPLYRSFFRSPR